MDTTAADKAAEAATRAHELERLRFCAAAEAAKLGARNPGTPTSIRCGDLLKAIALENPWSARDAAALLVKDGHLERGHLEHLATWLKAAGIGKDTNQKGGQK